MYFSTLCSLRSFAVDLFARGLHTRNAVARLTFQAFSLILPCANSDCPRLRFYKLTDIVRVTSYFFVLLYCIALHCITAQPPPQTENSSVSQILSSVAFLVLFGLPSRILDLNRILCAVCSWRFCFSVFFNIFFVSGYVYFIKPTILSFLFQPTLNSCIVVYRR